MKQYEPLGKHIRLVDKRNGDLVTDKVLGISIDKFFMPSVANVIGTDLSRYKLLSKGLFACNPMHVGRDERLPVALYDKDTPAIVSPAYFMFEIIDKSVLNDEYLMMWFRRLEFDRICWLKTDGSVRGGITWEDICRIEIPVIPFDQQEKIVKNYRALTDRINLKRRINDNLAEQAVSYIQTIMNQDVSRGKPWETLTVRDLVDRHYIEAPMDGNHGEIHPKSSDYVSSGVPFVMANNLTNGYVDYSNCAYISESQAKKLRKGFAKPRDVLLTHKATLGRTAIVTHEYETTILTPQVTYYRAINYVTPEFLRYYFETPTFQSTLEAWAGAGSTRAYIGITKQLELPICFPHRDSMVTITNMIEKTEKVRYQNHIEITKLMQMQETLLTRISSH